jgi:serine phosphatase RsbU (regulator of sigma subunit)
MDPAREVGGDFYDFFFVGPDRMALVIADVSDKGIPAALFMMRSKTAIRGLAESGYEPDEIFYRVNNELCEGNELNMFVTVWMGILDLNTGDMRCLNAGHEYPAVMRNNGDYEVFRDKHHLPLGAIKDMKYTGYDMHLDPGDCLYVYTDGIPDAINVNEEEYGLERLLNALNTYKDASMEGLLQGVKADQDAFVGEADQFDDITMLGFRYNGPQDE